MKLTVIGFWGGYPKAGEASTGYLIEHKGFRLLLDCGSGVLSQLPNYIQPEQLDALVVTHYHADHIADVGVLQHAFIIQRILQNKPYHLKAYGHQEDPHGFAGLTHGDVMTGIPYTADESLNVGPFTLTFLKTHHPVPCYAVRIEADGQSLVFTADTSYFSELGTFAKGTDLLIAECNFYKGMDGKGAGHMTSEEAGKLAQDAGASRLLLTHLPHFGELSQLKVEAEEQFDGVVELASSGLQIDLS